MFFANAFVVLSVGFVVVDSAIYSEDIQIQTELWESFKQQHEKSYHPEAEGRYFANFLESLKRIDSLNAQETERGGQAVYGITRFSDLSQDEFKDKYLNNEFPMLKEMSHVQKFDVAAGASACSAPAATTVNWAGIQTTAVKDQGYCGSCWSFAVAQQMESDILRKNGSNYRYVLSEQQLLDCDTEYQSGCDGGIVFYGFQYLQSSYIQPNSTYPYTSYYNTNPQTCKYNPNLGVAGVIDIYTPGLDENCMANYVQQYGTLSVAVNADSWNDYAGGVWTPTNCGNGDINHAVQIVGVNIPGGYWIVRNSWSSSWGENGYIYLQFGANTCNITSIYPLLVDPFLYSAPASSSSSSSDSNALSTGAIAGIAIGVIAGVLIIGGLIAWFFIAPKKPPLASTAGTEKAAIEAVM